MTSERTTATYPDLAGKTAFTGGSKGIGRVVCRQLAANGARVAVAGREAIAVEAVVAEITGDGGKAVGVAVDCSSESGLAVAHKQVGDTLGPVDLLVAFAGRFKSFTPVVEMGSTSGQR